MNDAYAITIDVDWAPDFMIDLVSKELSDSGIRAIWFITHDLPSVRRLLELIIEKQKRYYTTSNIAENWRKGQ